MNIPNHPRIEMLATSSLTANARNARKHSDMQIAKLAANIERFGFLVPIVVDDDKLIAAGHGRWEAARRLGIEMVPTIRASFVSDKERRAFALADNRLAELSDWDAKLLGEELSFLFKENYDIDTLGFTTADLDFSVVKAPPPSAEPEQVELPDPDADAVSRLGDLWLIGPHRLFCGNAREAESYEAVLAGELAGMIFCDPPYNVPITGHVAGLGKTSYREFHEASGEMSPAEFTAFLRVIFRNCARFSTDGSIHYQCMDWRHAREILDAADGVYTAFKQLVVWKKSSAGMGAFYRSQHELVFVFKSGRAAHTNNFGLGETGRYRTNVWEYEGANTFRKGRDEDLAAHPSVKSTPMVIDAMLDCSHLGDIVLDPCSGSGTVLIAAHHSGRRGAAIEIDPLYVDTAIRRLEGASGLEATLADGRTFQQVQQDRTGGEIK